MSDLQSQMYAAMEEALRARQKKRDACFCSACGWRWAKRHDGNFVAVTGIFDAIEASANNPMTVWSAARKVDLSLLWGVSTRQVGPRLWFRLELALQQ